MEDTKSNAGGGHIYFVWIDLEIIVVSRCEIDMWGFEDCEGTCEHHAAIVFPYKNNFNLHTWGAAYVKRSEPQHSHKIPRAASIQIFFYDSLCSDCHLYIKRRHIFTSTLHGLICLDVEVENPLWPLLPRNLFSHQCTAAVRITVIGKWKIRVISSAVGLFSGFALD